MANPVWSHVDRELGQGQMADMTTAGDQLQGSRAWPYLSEECYKYHNLVHQLSRVVSRTKQQVAESKPKQVSLPKS